MTDAMYQEQLLAHYRAPHNRRSLDAPTSWGAYRNPLCGDEIRVELLLDGALVADVGFTGRGCSIAVASASMLTDAVRGRTVGEALCIASALEELLGKRPVPDGEIALPDSMSPLRGVVPFRGRHGCAMMPWQALRDALQGTGRPDDAAHADA